MSNMRIYTKQQLDDNQRQFNWERGQIDYLGIDSFDNILKQLNNKIDPSVKAPAIAIATTAETAAVTPVTPPATTAVTVEATAESAEATVAK